MPGALQPTGVAGVQSDATSAAVTPDDSKLATAEAVLRGLLGRKLPGRGGFLDHVLVSVITNVSQQMVPHGGLVSASTWRRSSRTSSIA